MLTQLFVKPGNYAHAGVDGCIVKCAARLEKWGDLHVTMHCAEGMPAEMSGHWPETVQVDWIEGRPLVWMTYGSVRKGRVEVPVTALDGRVLVMGIPNRAEEAVA